MANTSLQPKCYECWFYVQNTCSGKPTLDGPCSSFKELTEAEKQKYGIEH